MRTPASVAGHPIHPMIVTIPIGLWLFSLACDLWSLWRGVPDPWNVVAFYAMAGGFVGALLAAIPGVIDLTSMKDPEVRRIGVTHMTINLLIVGAYAVNLWMRAHGWSVAGAPTWLSLLSILALGVSGWLGGSMVHRHGVGVDTSVTEPVRSTGAVGNRADTIHAGRH